MHELFISIPFSAEFADVSNLVRKVAEQRGFAAYRADDGRHAVPLAEEIRSRLEESHVVVADISGENPNVYHEVGLAQAFGKSLVLLTRDRPTAAAFNLRGQRMIRYQPSELLQLENELKQALAETVSPNEMLRAMLVPGSLGRPTSDSRFFVAASPLSFRRAVGRVGGYGRLRRTASDYVGVRGIMQAFGLLYGFGALPDIIDPEDCKDEVIEEDMTLYCIASPKANRWTRALLEAYQRKWPPHLEFRAEAKSTNLRNIPVSIFADDGLLHPPGWDFLSAGDRYRRDFGLIVRGPNPFHEQRMVAVLAGRSSLGTEAACRAFVTPDIGAQIRERLRGHRLDLEDHSQPFWAIVSMRRSIGDELEETQLESLSVDRVEPFKVKRR